MTQTDCVDRIAVDAMCGGRIAAYGLLWTDCRRRIGVDAMRGRIALIGLRSMRCAADALLRTGCCGQIAADG